MSENRVYIFSAGSTDVDERMHSVLHSYRDYREDSILGILGLDKYNLISEIVMYNGWLSTIFEPIDGDYEGVPQWAIDYIQKRDKAEESYKSLYKLPWEEDFENAIRAYEVNFPLTSASLMTMIYDDLKKLEIEISEKAANE